MDAATNWKARADPWDGIGVRLRVVDSRARILSPEAALRLAAELVVAAHLVRRHRAVKTPR